MRCLVLFALAACTPAVVAPVEPIVKTVRPPDAPVVIAADEAPRAALTAFLAAVDGRKFDAALAMLSQELRARYTVERFSTDFFAEPLAVERVARLREHSKESFTVDGDRALLPLGGPKAAELRREAGDWKLVRLE